MNEFAPVHSPFDFAQGEDSFTSIILTYVVTGFFIKLIEEVVKKRELSLLLFSNLNYQND